LYFVFQGIKIKCNMPARNRLRRGNMDESIGQPVAKAGVDGVVAEKTVGIMLGFVRNEGRSEKVETLIDRIPRAEAAILATNSGSGISGLMAAGKRLTAVGLAMGEIHSIAPELLSVSLDKIGAGRMGEIIAGTPGLGQFA
jgi:hypothetical protein